MELPFAFAAHRPPLEIYIWKLGSQRIKGLWPDGARTWSRLQLNAFNMQNLFASGHPRFGENLLENATSRGSRRQRVRASPGLDQSRTTGKVDRRYPVGDLKAAAASSARLYTSKTVSSLVICNMSRMRVFRFASLISPPTFFAAA